MIHKIIWKLKKITIFIRRFGFIGLLKELCSRTYNFYHETRLGVDTTGIIKSLDLGFNNSDFADHVPMGYKALYSSFKRIPLDHRECTILDYGSGKGRAVVVAATLNFKKVIGIEISERLIEVARKNIAMMHHRNAHCVEFHQIDATEFIVPNDVNIIYLFNPFKGEVLRKVLDRIYESQIRYPRKLFIIYFNYDFFEKLIRKQKWIKKIYDTSCYPNYSCGIYEIGSVNNVSHF